MLYPHTYTHMNKPTLTHTQLREEICNISARIFYEALWRHNHKNHKRVTGELATRVIEVWIFRNFPLTSSKHVT